MKELTEETMAGLKHTAAEAILGAILDTLRSFLDKWYGHHTPPLGWDWRAEGNGREKLPDFFKDLGELRSRMRTFIGMLTEFDPKATAPRLFERSVS